MLLSSQKIEDFLLKACQIGIACVLFLPLVLLSYFKITPDDQSSKVLIFQSIIEVVFLFYGLLVLTNKNHLPKKSILFSVFILFFFVEFISGIFGINFFRSLFGNLTRADGIILHLHLMLFFIVLISIFKEKEDWLKLFKISVIVSAISSLAALSQKLGFHWFYFPNPERLPGTLVNAGMFGNYIALSIFFAVFIIFAEKSKKLRIFWCFLLILNFLALFLSGTRGAFVGVAAGFFLFLIAIFWQNKKLTFEFFKKRTVLFLVLFLIFIIIFFGFLKFIDFYKDKSRLAGRVYNVITFDLESSRKVYWKTALAGFLKRPILGWGGDSFNFVWDKYAGFNDLENKYEIEPDKPHNKVLEIAVSNGIAGLFIWILGFFIIFYLIFKNKKYPALAGFFLCYFTVNFFLFDTISTYILFFLVAGFVNNNFGETVNRQSVSASVDIISGYKIAFAVILIAVIAFFFYNLNVKTALAGMYFASGESSGTKEPLGALYGYQKALEQNSFYDYDFKMLVLSRMNLLMETNPPLEVKTGVFDLFFKIEPDLYKYMEASDQQKNRLYLYTDRMYKWIYLFNKDSKNLDKMQNTIQQGINFNPNYPYFYLDMAKLKVLQNNFKEVAQFAQKFYQLTPQKAIDEEKMHLAVAQSYFEINDLERGIINGEKVLEIEYNLKKSGYAGLNLPNFTNSTAMACHKIGRVQEALKIYQRAMEIYPDYRNLWQRGLEYITQD